MIIDIDVSKMTPEQRKRLEENQREIMQLLEGVPFLECKPAVYGVDVRERKVAE